MNYTAEIQSYLRKVLGSDAELVSVHALGEEEHDTGISKLQRLEVRSGSQTRQLILRKPASTVYSTEQLSDRAHAVLQAYELYKHIPRHPESIDVAVIRADGTLDSIRGDSEFILLQEYAPGDLYFPTLLQSLESDEPDELADQRAVALAEYLIELHSEKRRDDQIYRRSLRDLVGSGVGVMGVMGGYSNEVRDEFHDQLSDILRDFISLSWNIGSSSCERLCRVHGDFHPLNILFGEGTDLTAIDATGTGWGDAAFDVGILFMNYYALYNQAGRLSSPSGERLAERFMNTYTAGCQDREGLYRVLPLALARGALIMATTDFFPHRPMDERERLIRLAGDILSAGIFTPELFDQ